MTAKAKKKERKVGESFTIDLTPTWVEILPTLLHIYEKGDAEGRKYVLEELSRPLAEVDKLNAEGKKERKKKKKGGK